MNVISPRQRRLKNTYQAMQALAQRSGSVSSRQANLRRFEFKNNGNPDDGEFPDMYGVTLRIQGVKKFPPLEYLSEHLFTIYLTEKYPVEKPVVKWHTPIYHPNIKIFDENDSRYQALVDEFGSVELMSDDINRDPRWANLLDGYICLDALKENWTPYVGLDDLIVEIANMVRYQTFNVNSPLNEAAAKWAKEQMKLRHFFPLDQSLVDPAQEKPLIRIESTKRTDLT